MSRRSKRKQPRVAWTSTRTRWLGDILVETDAGIVARRDEHSSAAATHPVLVLLASDVTAEVAIVELRRLIASLVMRHGEGAGCSRERGWGFRTPRNAEIPPRGGEAA